MVARRSLATFIAAEARLTGALKVPVTVSCSCGWRGQRRKFLYDACPRCGREPQQEASRDAS